MAAIIGSRPSGRHFTAAAFAFLFCALAARVPAATARGLEDPGSFQTFADSLMTAEMARGHVPGGVLVAVRGGEIFCARGYGYADLERRTPVDPERTIFRVASVSKVFTATAVMQLVEQGRLTLDEDVNHYLKRFRIEPGSEPVTLRQLLTHTAGFDDRNIDRKAHTAAGMESLGAYLARRMPARFLPAGRFLCYSNHGMALAGYLVEEASGQPFERYLRDSLFAPLGMTRSTFAPQAVAPADLALGYDDSDPPRRKPVEYVKTAPASMLTTTGVDVARFAIAQLRGGTGRILGESAIEDMQRQQFAQDPELSGIGFGFWERFQNGERALWHDGDGGGFASLLYLLPEQGTGFFLVFNGSGGGVARRDVLEALLDRYFPDTRENAPPVPFEGAAAEARRCAGTYVFNRYGHLGLERLTSLEAQIEASASGGTLSCFGNQYVAIAPLRFQRLDGGSWLVFEADGSGRIVRMFSGESIARVYERVPWYETAAAQLILVGSCVAIFLAALVAWPLAGLVRRLRRIADAGRPRTFERLAIVASALNLLFVAGFFGYVTESPSQLEFGVPALFLALLTIPLLSAALGAALVALCVKAWRNPATSLGTRLRFALVALAAVGFLAWLAEWNLLGYRY